MTTVEPAVSDRPKCKGLVVAYGMLSLTRIESQGVSSKKRSGHIDCLVEHLLHALTGVVGGVGDRKAAGFTRLNQIVKFYRTMTSIYTGFKLNGMRLVITSILCFQFLYSMKMNKNYHDVANTVKNDDQQ